MNNERLMSLSIQKMLDELNELAGCPGSFRADTRPDLDLGEEVLVVSWAKPPLDGSLDKVLEGGYSILGRYAAQFEEMGLSLTSNLAAL